MWYACLTVHRVPKSCPSLEMRLIFLQPRVLGILLPPNDALNSLFMVVMKSVGPAQPFRVI